MSKIRVVGVDHKFADGILTNVNPKKGGVTGVKRLYATPEQVYEVGLKYYPSSYHVRKYWEQKEQSPVEFAPKTPRQLVLPEIPNPASAPIPAVSYPVPPPQVINVQPVQTIPVVDAPKMEGTEVDQKLKAIETILKLRLSSVTKLFCIKDIVS